uniref:C2H2-type domain-containing protein n=1 Tax=Heliothis virescens TaxID=7102 RepID=A0A2A4JBW6_HELVI
MDKHKEKQSCKICGNTFVNANGLKVHMFTVHGQSSRVYQCEYCDKRYRARSGYEAHQRSAHSAPDERAFCVECKTHYRTKKGLAHHLSTHSKHVTESDKRFICDECGAKFVTKSNLQVHINWEHFKINTHKCSKCTKEFKSRTALNRHVTYVHLKKRPPRNKICDYCGRAFTTQSILQCHIRSHTGERPLQCTQCAATFAHAAALYTHNKLLHARR